jgi:hypothetical protein
VIEDKKIRTAIKGHIPFESTLRGIDVGESRPAGTGGGTQWNGDAGQGKAMGKQLAGVQHFSAPGSQNGVTALRFSSHPLEILLTAVELKLSLKGLKPLGQEIRHQTLSLIRSGSTATKHQRT